MRRFRRRRRRRGLGRAEAAECPLVRVAAARREFETTGDSPPAQQQVPPSVAFGQELPRALVNAVDASSAAADGPLARQVGRPVVLDSVRGQGRLERVGGVLRELPRRQHAGALEHEIVMRRPISTVGEDDKPRGHRRIISLPVRAVQGLR